MSYHDYRESQRIELKGYSFYAIVMAAMRQADTANTELLVEAFPQVHAELSQRYNAPGGLLEGETVPEHGN